MALGYSYSGWTKLVSPSWLDGTAVARVLDSPLARPGVLRELLLALPSWLLRLLTWGSLALELSFTPLALVRRARPWIWAALLAMHLGLIILIAFADLSLGMVFLHLFTFDPAWLRPTKAPTEMLFYDPRSQLGRWVVRFVMAEDQAGDSFQCASLDSATFRDTVPHARKVNLRGPVVVRTGAGVLLCRSAAGRHLLWRLGGFWRLVDGLLGLIPATLGDRLWDAVGRWMAGREGIPQKPLVDE